MRSNIPTTCIILATVAGSPVLRAGGPDFQGIGTSTASGAVAISGDGTVVVGKIPTAAGPAGEAFRWTAGDGLILLGDLPGGAFFSESAAVSHDGSVIVGRSWSTSGFEAFRWTEAEGMVGLGGSGSWALAVSSDGLVVAGGAGGEAFYWTAGGGMVGLGDLGVCCDSTALGVSADGMIVIGTGDPPDAGNEGFRWTAGAGMVGLGPGNEINSEAQAISADGSVIVGLSNNTAVRWTTGGTEMGELGPFPGGSTYSRATAVSADGSVIVGYATTPAGQDDPFIWDATNGMRNLEDVLVTDLGLDLTGWSLHGAFGISADGLKVVGLANNPSGNEAWIATLGAGDPADLDGDGVVGISDFLTLLASWGPCPALPDPCPADLDGDGSVGINDFLTLLASWG